MGQLLQKLVSVYADSTKNKYYFKQDEQLENSLIKEVEFFRVGKVAKDPTGATVVSDAAFAVSFLTIQSGSNEKMAQRPLTTLNAGDNNGIIKPVNIDGITLTRCFIEIQDASLVTTGQAYVMLVTYQTK